MTANLRAVAEAAEALARACRAAAGSSPETLADSREPEQVSPAMQTLLKPAEVAARLAVNPRTLRRLVHLGQVPAPVTVGGAKRWRPADLDAWLASGRVSPPPSSARRPTAARNTRARSAP